MACQRPAVCNLPVIVLWRLFAFLDDDSLLTFLSSCYHIFDVADEDDTEWQRWFMKRFSDSIETSTWRHWHIHMLDKTHLLFGKNRDNRQQSNGSHWLQHCIARLCLERNWRQGITSLQEFTIPNTSFSDTSTLPTTRIVTTSVWGTLLLTNNGHLYYVTHELKPKLTYLYDLSNDCPSASYSFVSGISNKHYIVAVGPLGRNNTEFNDENQQWLYYWNTDKLESQPPRKLEYLDKIIKIESLNGHWLLLREPILSDENHAACIVNLAHPMPIPVRTATHWNTYSIVESADNTCTIYAGALNTNTQLDSTLYSWDLLQSSLIDVRTVASQQRIIVPLRVSKLGERRCRLLNDNVIMVWQIPVKSPPSSQSTLVESSRRNSTEFNTPRNTHTFANASSATPACQSNIFFIHDVKSSFLGQVPIVSLQKKRIIILNESSLELVDMATRQTIFETTVAKNLIHLGFVLTGSGCSASSGGFFTMSMDQNPQIGWIPSVSGKGTAAISTTTVTKVSDNEIAIWSMHPSV
ncbi:hypothetical protein BDF19DRAFT_412715 [Syncephalis fuscata]|nr:hypothetical protein BDF19DRAFT_412715 [Syncephalis fuscata]